MKKNTKFFTKLLLISMIVTLVYGFTITASAAKLVVEDVDIEDYESYVIDAGETENVYGIDFSVKAKEKHPDEESDNIAGHIEISRGNAFTFESCDKENAYSIAMHRFGVVDDTKAYTIKSIIAESAGVDVVFKGDGWTVHSEGGHQYSEWHGNSESVSFSGGGKVHSFEIEYDVTDPSHVDRIRDGMTGACGESATYTLHVRGENTFDIVVSGTGKVNTDSPDIDWTGLWSGKPYKYNVTIEEGITSIGTNGFANQPGLLSITLPDSLEAIDYGAFHNCTGLKSIDLPDGLTTLSSSAFEGCNRLRSIVVPKGVTVIEDDTFKSCTNLASVVLEGPVTAVKGEAFADCRNLKSVVLSDSLATLGWAAFQNCYNLQSINTLGKITELAADVFANCRSFENIPIPDTVTSIHQDALCGSGIRSITIPKTMTQIQRNQFENCANLTTVTLHDGVTSIGYAAFSGCTSLSEIELNEGLTTILNEAFSGCSSLQNVTFPETLKTIGSNAFDGAGLTSVVIPDSLTSYSSEMFCNCKNLKSVTLSDHISAIPDYLFSGCTSLTSIDIPECVTSIGRAAFANTGLTSVTVPAQIKTGGYEAFAGSAVKEAVIIGATGGSMFADCKDLVSVEFKEGATSIAGNMFSNCPRLESVSISKTVTSIGYAAFNGCTGIRSLTIPSTVTTIGINLFNGYNLNFVSVSIGCQFKSRISEIFLKCPNLKDITYTHVFNCVDIDADKHTESCKYGDMEKGAVPHVYDSGCDPVCNLCGHERTELVHTGGKATCTEKAVCEVCGTAYGEPKGHAWNADFTIDIPATCTEDGSKSIHCANCDETKDTTVIRAAGHSGGKATCTEKAVCAVCGTAYGEPKGHAWDDDFTIDVPPTCTKDGTKSVHCANCDKTKYSTVAPATGHSGGKATCVKKAVCQVCGTEYGELSDHTWEEDFTVDIPATCTEDGIKSIHCVYCGKTKSSTAIPAEGHVFAGRKCTVCGYTKKSATSDMDVSVPPSVTVSDCIHGSLEVFFSNNTVMIEAYPDKGYVLETIAAVDKDGNEIPLTQKDGIFSFTLLSGGAKISATFMEDNSMLNFFVDVPSDTYFYDAVLWAAENNITSGVDDSHFGPTLDCSRAQVVTFLWRAVGAPEPASAACSFVDLDKNAYYYKAVLWAVENGITAGVDAAHFAPNADVTRAQVVTFLYRAAEGDTVGSSSFADVPAGAYYEKAVNWAVANGITNGTGHTTFSPDANCTRAEIVTFLFRAMR